MSNIMPKEDVLKQSHKALQSLLKTKADALPKDFNETRFLQNCMTVLQDTYNIEKCQPMSIARTMLKGAFLGLDFFNRECYAIPYNDYKKNITTLQFQPDYKGEKKLAKKYSIKKIDDIYAKVVREGDEFEEFIEKGKRYVNFRPKPFNNSEIIGAFAVVVYTDESMDYETMSKEDIEKVKVNFSKTDKKGEYSKAWTATPGEMYKKTVLRRLCKHIELDFDSIEQKKTFDEASDFEFKNDTTNNKQIEKSPFDNAVDVEYKDAKDEATATIDNGEEVGENSGTN